MILKSYCHGWIRVKVSYEKFAIVTMRAKVCEVKRVGIEIQLVRKYAVVL